MAKLSAKRIFFSAAPASCKQDESPQPSHCQRPAHAAFRSCTRFPHAAHGPFVVGRKNWLFCDSVKGAESSAIVYSLVETAKANGIEPYGYLLLVLSMLPYLGKSPTHEELEKLMPWHPAVRHREHIRK